MANIYRRGDTWWIKYSQSGRVYRESFKTKSKPAARRELQAREVLLLEGHQLAPAKKNPTLDDFWDKYLDWATEHIRPRSIEAATNSWRHLTSYVKATKLGDITHSDIEAFKRAMRKAKKSPTSVNHYLIDIGAIFNRGIREGWYTGQNPVERIERYKVPRTKPEFHSEEDLNNLLEAAKERGRDIEWTVLLGGWAGLRKMEIVNTRWEWLDFDKKRPLIYIQAFPGFTVKDHEDRTVPMSRRIYSALYPHRKSEGFLFKSGRRNEGRSRYRFDPKKGLDIALKEAGLTLKDPFQRLRRFFGSVHVGKGKSIYHVSKWLGHSSVQVTERHYLHLGPKAYDADIDAL